MNDINDSFQGDAVHIIMHHHCIAFPLSILSFPSSLGLLGSRPPCIAPAGGATGALPPLLLSFRAKMSSKGPNKRSKASLSKASVELRLQTKLGKTRPKVCHPKRMSFLHDWPWGWHPKISSIDIFIVLLFVSKSLVIMEASKQYMEPSKQTYFKTIEIKHSKRIQTSQKGSLAQWMQHTSQKIMFNLQGDQ